MTWRPLALTLAFFLVTLAAPADTLSGRAVGVHDGDTITVLAAGNRQTKVRLNQIDAPELRQDYGQSSKQALSSLVFGKQIRVEVDATDKYGRTLGTVWVGATNANLEQVKGGMAWAYKQYAKDPAYAAAEADARGARRGLWAQRHPTPPWEYRHSKKASGGFAAWWSELFGRSASRPRVASSKCGSKKTCGEMTSCEEARHYLNDCGVQSLDRNHDGVPCESLCQ